jgi:hypothetical protein
MALVTISNTPVCNRRLADVFRRAATICEMPWTSPVNLADEIEEVLKEKKEGLPSAELDTAREYFSALLAMSKLRC